MRIQFFALAVQDFYIFILNILWRAAMAFFVMLNFILGAMPTSKIIYAQDNKRKNVTAAIVLFYLFDSVGTVAALYRWMQNFDKEVKTVTIVFRDKSDLITKTFDLFDDEISGDFIFDLKSL